MGHKILCGDRSPSEHPNYTFTCRWEDGWYASQPECGQQAVNVRYGSHISVKRPFHRFSTTLLVNRPPARSICLSEKVVIEPLIHIHGARSLVEHITNTTTHTDMVPPARPEAHNESAYITCSQGYTHYI